MYLVLHAQGECAHSRWVGLSYDIPVISGLATLARTQDAASSRHDPPTRRRDAGMTDADLVE